MRIAIVVPDNRDEFRQYDAPAPFFGPAPTALLQGFAELPEHEFHIVCCVRRKMQCPEKIAPNIYYHAALVHQWGWLKSAYLPCLSAVRKIIRAIDPDIVHGQGTERYAAISSVYSGKPSVLTIHGNMRAIAALMGAKPLSFHWLTAKLETFTLPKADGIVCLSSYTRDQVAGLARKTWVVANATGNEFFQESTPLHEPPVLFCPAIICPRKNQNALLRALDEVAMKHPFRLVLAGGCDAESAYCQVFQELARARPWCEFIGNIHHSQLPQLHRQADLLVLPSVEDNCPMAILEAFAGGKPVAASGVCGILDLVTDGQEGVLFDPNDPKSIAEKISGLLANREALSAMGKKARATADAKHSPRAVALAHLDIYRQVLEARQR